MSRRRNAFTTHQVFVSGIVVPRAWTDGGEIERIGIDTTDELEITIDEREGIGSQLRCHLRERVSVIGVIVESGSLRVHRFTVSSGRLP